MELNQLRAMLQTAALPVSYKTHKVKIKMVGSASHDLATDGLKGRYDANFITNPHKLGVYLRGHLRAYLPLHDNVLSSVRLKFKFIPLLKRNTDTFLTFLLLKAHSSRRFHYVWLFLVKS